MHKEIDLENDIEHALISSGGADPSFLFRPSAKRVLCSANQFCQIMLRSKQKLAPQKKGKGMRVSHQIAHRKYAIHSKHAMTSRVPMMLALAMVMSMPVVPIQAASAADQLTYHLEAGGNVRTLDLGTDGLKALTAAIERLNAPPPPPSPPVAPAKAAAAAAPAVPDKAAAAPAASSQTTAAIPRGPGHPAWLTGRWVTTAQCPAGTANPHGFFEIAPHQVKFAHIACDIQAVSAPQNDLAVVIYRCLTGAKVTQESHVFQQLKPDELLLDNVTPLKRCDAGA